VRHLVARIQAAAPGQDGDLLAGVDHVGGLLELLLRWHRIDRREDGAAVLGFVAHRLLAVVHRPVLDVLGDGDVRDAAPGERHLDGLVDHADHVMRAHHALVIDRDVHEQFVEVDILLVVCANEVVEGMAGVMARTGWLSMAAS
jgi:hypothetical protein